MRGHELLSELESNSRKYERQLRDAEKELSQANEQTLRLQHTIGEILSGLAALHLEHNGAQRDEVAQLLRLRSQEEASLRDHLSVTEARIEAAMVSAAEARDAVDAADERASMAFESNSEAQRLKALCHEAQSALENHADEYEDIRGECKVKLATYESDPLFQYLLKAGFGTPEYKRRGIVRWLDQWISDATKYLANRANYAILIAMAKQNEAGRQESERALSQMLADLEHLRSASQVDAGTAAAREALLNVEDTIKDLKNQANSFHERLAAYTTNTDPRYKQATAALAKRFADAPLDDLVEQARATQAPEDDALISRLVESKRQLNAISAMIPQQKERIAAYESGYKKAKKLERQIRDRGRVSSSARYDSSLDISSLVVGYMAGSISGDTIASSIDDHRKSSSSSSSPDFSSSNDFGGGGFSTSDSF